MGFNPQPKKGMPDKKLRTPLKRTSVKKLKRFNITDKQKKRIREKIKLGTKRLELVKILDSVFSKYIRMQHMDERGFVQCFTCPTSRPLAQMQNGHFVSRKNMSLRFEPINCRPQCKDCNEYKRGNLEVYAQRLGEKVLDEIASLKRQNRRWTQDELQSEINHYRKLIAELK